MKTLRTHFSLLLLLLIALGVFAVPAVRSVRAQDCLLCTGGGDPSTPTPAPPTNPPPTNPPPPPPTATPCVPHYDPPAISLDGYTPAYPLVIGQDPDRVGFDAVVGITAGQKTNSCPGPNQRSLSGVTLDYVTLAAGSQAWIETELAAAYPGAHVLGNYPVNPDYTVSLNGHTGTLSFHHDPLDPGYYDVVVTAIQDDGQSKTQTLQIPVYLLESTIIQ